jgi:hypothetical protein
MSKRGDQDHRPTPKRKQRRRRLPLTARNSGPDEADRFLLWLTALGDLQLALRAQIEV